MFTATYISYRYQGSLKNAAFDYNERGFGFVCSYKNKLIRNAVATDAGLSELR